VVCFTSRPLYHRYPFDMMLGIGLINCSGCIATKQLWIHELYCTRSLSNQQNETGRQSLYDNTCVCPLPVGSLSINSFPVIEPFIIIIIIIIIVIN
jgi:hypothetical protein